MKPVGSARLIRQLDFWPELSSLPMVAVARLVGSRALHHSGSEERSAASAGRQAPPTGNTGNEKRAAGNAR